MLFCETEMSKSAWCLFLDPMFVGFILVIVFIVILFLGCSILCYPCINLVFSQPETHVIDRLIDELFGGLIDRLID